MSRSRKKNPIIKDVATKRGVRNRRVRRVNKILVTIGKEPKKREEIINQYEVCDWILNGHSYKNFDRKYTRK